MKIIICHQNFAGYAAACWRCLAAHDNVELVVYATRPTVPFDDAVLSGVNVRVLNDNDLRDVNAFAARVVAEQPDIIDIGAWSVPAYKNLAFDRRLAAVKKVISVDTMWIGSWRQILARFALAPLVRRLDGIVVAGERGRQFARWIGFRRDKIFVSTYGYDAKLFDGCYEGRLKCGENWPRRFCYIGQYVERKGLLCVIKAYKKYREKYGNAAWPFECYGKGPLAKALVDAGIVDHGFTQPRDLPAALMRAGAFVFASCHEPWGVALAEAAGSGLPLICSDAVASGIDLVRHFYNGYVFPAESVERLFCAFCWMHEHSEQSARMGMCSRTYAHAYASDAWADRWLDMCLALGV